MQTGRKALLSAGLFIVMPLGMLAFVGCNKQEEAPPPPQGPTPGMSRGGGAPRGSGPVAADASGEEIYQAKCGCHGPGGKGGRAPVLTGVSSESDSKLTTTIHDGKGKMPAFGSQLSEAQIKKVVATIKGFK